MGAFIVAAVAAAAILLIFIGITAGRGSGVSSRLERYASARKGDPAAKKTGDGPVSDFLANSPALASFNKRVEERDFGANLARELARADLKLKVSEYIMYLGRLHARRAGHHVPAQPVLPDAGQPALPAHRRRRRLLHPALLAVAPQGGPAERLQQGPGRHHHAASPTPCAPARPSCRPSRWSCARRSRRSRPSSGASSARSTSASPSTTRWPTWSDAFGRTTWS